MFYYGGYDPGFSNLVTGLQAGIAGINAITDGLTAYNNGASPQQAVSYGVGSAAMGVSNALLGNVIDKTTHTYTGTTMNSIMNTFTLGNPYMTSIGMTGAALAMTPFMMSPMYNPFGCPSVWAAPMSFGPPVMGGLPPFGGFCVRC